MANRQDTIAAIATKINDNTAGEISAADVRGAFTDSLDYTDTVAGGKQDALSSGVNIKSVNGESLVGSGNISIGGGSGTVDPVPTDGSNNPVSSNGVFDALAGKANTSHTHTLSNLTQSGATTGQIPKWNGTAWIAADESGSSGAAEVPTNVVYLSKVSGVSNDAVLTIGSNTFGADSTAAIQAVLDKANNGALNVFWDVKTSITGLTIRSNTSIFVAPGCGAILRNGSNKTMFKNANVVFSNNANIVDQNISITGRGVWNGNAAGQSVKGSPQSGANCVFAWYGVRNLVVEDQEIITPKTYASHGINVVNGVYRRLRVDVGNGAINMDGLHFDGWCTDCLIEGCWLNTHDDGIGCNADDFYTKGQYFDGVTQGYYPATACGPASNITWRDNHFASQLYGYRILSGASRVNNILIENTTGSTSGYGLIVDNYSANPSIVDNPGNGNIGKVTVRGFNLDLNAVDYFPAVIAVSTSIEELVLEDVTRRDFGLAVPTMLCRGANKKIDVLKIKGYTAQDFNSVTAHFETTDGFTIGKIMASDCTVEGGGNANTPLFKLGANVGRLQMTGIEATGIANVVQIVGTSKVNLINAASIIHTNDSRVDATFFNGSAAAVDDICMSAYTGYAPTDGVFTSERGDAFAGASMGDLLQYIPPAPASFIPLSFPTRDTSLQEVAGVYRATTLDNNWGHRGVSTVRLEAGQDGAIIHQITSAKDGWGAQLGVVPSQTLTNYDAMLVGFKYYAGFTTHVGGNQTVQTGISLIDGNYYGIFRQAGAFTLRTSADAQTWTTLYTYPFTNNGVIYAAIDVFGDADSNMNEPEQSGLA